MHIKQVDVPTLKEWLAHDNVVLIDVREPAEHAIESIPDAILLPLSTLTPEQLPVIDHKKVVVHCRSGQRSLRACELLLTADPTLDIYNLEGGILAWHQR